ncbi:MAG TPA: 4Fe-4S dicluster domain-containing protein [Geobacteraceae bacterium]|nr:4Fe-4S dicluster domain-containing protein [Geobacteraceae bacterium]
MGKKSILIIPERCTGCRACQVACKNWNDLPAQKTSFTGSFNSPTDLTSVNFNRINFTEVPSEKDPIRWLFVSQRCMHCTDAGCMKICSTPGALTRNKEGAVVTDQEKCAGCHLCIAGCPFNVPRYGKDGKLAKCTMCADRIPKGMAPACVHTCPPQALLFGERDEMIAKARKLGYPVIYGQMDLGGLGTMIAFKDAPSLYGFADKPAINQAVIFWHKFLKPASWLGIGGMTALMALHYFGIGPKKEKEDPEEEKCMCQVPVPTKEEGKHETQ